MKHSSINLIFSIPTESLEQKPRLKMFVNSLAEKCKTDENNIYIDISKLTGGEFKTILDSMYPTILNDVSRTNEQFSRSEFEAMIKEFINKNK